jgi:hypothetical protein
MELRDALVQIAEIRQQVARTEMFRGYRALPVAFSGLLALTAAGLQPLLVAEPVQNLPAYLALWLGAALLSVLATACAMAGRLRRTTSPLEREKLFLAIAQFLPSVVAGAMLFLVFVRFAPESVWLLPGLWAMLFGLGIFASARFLPGAMIWVGVYYLLAGAFSAALYQAESALSPWAMAVPFAAGQLLAAAILYWTLERPDGQTKTEP